MKNIFLIVNIGILIFFSVFFYQKSYVSAQTPTIINQNTTSNPLDLLKELLSILFSFNPTSSSPPAGFPTPTFEPNPSITITPFITGLPNQSIQDVVQLVNNIGTYCQGRITLTNVSCLNNFSIQQNAKNILISSVIAYGVEQCGDWSKAMAAMINGDYWGEIGSAMELIHAPPPQGYRFIPKTIGGIQVGDFPVWTYDTYGHTAIVTQVISTTSFQLAEANYDSNGGVRLRTKTMTSDGSDQLAGWLRKL